MTTPLAAFTYGLEILVESMRMMQQVADRGTGFISGPIPVIPETSSEQGSGPPSSASASEVPDTQTTQKETRKMRDTDLSNRQDIDCKPDCEILKLVRYKILFVMRDYECAFPEEEELVADELTDTAFTAWKIAEFVQRLDDEKDPIRSRLPSKWVKYLGEKCKDTPNAKHPKAEDKKFLRVYYEVLERYPREKLRYHEQELEELRNINSSLSKIGSSIGPPS
jgi:hypothetical protein